MCYGHAVTDGLMCNQRQIFVGQFDEIAGIKVLGFAKPVCSEPPSQPEIFGTLEGTVNQFLNIGDVSILTS